MKRPATLSRTERNADDAKRQSRRAVRGWIEQVRELTFRDPGGLANLDGGSRPGQPGLNRFDHRKIAQAGDADPDLGIRSAGLDPYDAAGGKTAEVERPVRRCRDAFRVGAISWQLDDLGRLLGIRTARGGKDDCRQDRKRDQKLPVLANDTASRGEAADFG